MDAPNGHRPARGAQRAGAEGVVAEGGEVLLVEGAQEGEATTRTDGRMGELRRMARASGARLRIPGSCTYARLHYASPPKKLTLLNADLIGMHRRLGELASWILVDNKAVPLYKTEAEGAMKLWVASLSLSCQSGLTHLSRSTCYLEAVEGAEFAVGFRDEREIGENDAADFLCEVVVDGVVCGCVSSCRDRRGLCRGHSYACRGLRICSRCGTLIPRSLLQGRPADHPRVEEDV